MRVYVLTMEIQGQSGEGGTVIGVYRTHAAAHRALRAQVADDHKRGQLVWGYPNPNIEDDDGEDPDWDYTYEIESSHVQGREPRAPRSDREAQNATHRALYAREMYDHLKHALRLAEWAGARQVIPRIRYALKSAEGAKRHAHLRTIKEHR
jgi:hypothetical protein